MPVVHLTDRGIKNLSTESVQEDFFDTVTPGLILRVSATGRKVWAVRYQRNGTKRRMKLGTYPTLPLAKARDRARDAIRDADKGDDPAQEREDARKGLLTFKDMADEALTALATRTRETTQAERQRILKRDLLPAWGNRPPNEITRRDVVQLVEAIATRGAGVMANRVLALVKVIFNEALGRGFPGVEANPAHLLRPPGQEEGRDRYLTAKEVRAVWNATAPENPSTRAAIRLALLTAQRIGSVLAVQWTELEDMAGGTLWRIPPESFKGRRVHVVPLSTEAAEIVAGLRKLREDGEPYVFPSRDRAKAPHLSNFGKALIRIRRRSKLPHWTLHDFRTTFRTHAVRATEDGGLGVAGPVADAVLGHKEATLGFDRYTGDKDAYLLHEKREALRTWGAWIAKAVEEEARPASVRERAQ
jgi:integrase